MTIGDIRKIMMDNTEVAIETKFYKQQGEFGDLPISILDEEIECISPNWDGNNEVYIKIYLKDKEN